MKTFITSLVVATMLSLTGSAANAQNERPLSPDVAPPVSPPLLPRPAYDPSPDPVPEQPAPPAPRPSELDTAPPGMVIEPPESGLTVTPGHYISGCVQLPAYSPRGPYTQQPPWPFGDIPFEYDSNVSQANRNLFQNAMNEVHDYCGVDFRARNQFDLAWLHIQTSSANNAPIGFFPGEHIVNIFNFNVQHIMVHELFHVIGVYHEQARNDRDNYVTINTGNISQTECQDSDGNAIPCNPQFDKQNTAAVFGAYNFDSIMHYARDAFNIGSTDTITVKPEYAGIWQSRIGQRTHATFGDRSTAIRLYQPGWAKVAKINSNPNGPGTWSSPYNNFPDAYNAAPTGGDVIILSGYYTGLAKWSGTRRVHAPDGNVRIGQ
jgi:hypothetical protein